MAKFLLGLDDTDSHLGHCTTHLGYRLIAGFLRIGCTFSTYPRLVRLNPNIPFKTRGNAAVCVEFEAGPALAEEAFGLAVDLLSEEADVANGANSALLMVPGASAESLEFCGRVYRRAISGVVGFRAVIKEVSRRGIPHRLLGNGMGVVGAVACLGFSPGEDDHTYELISYRNPERCGTPRRVAPSSVEAMEAETFPHTFNSFDHESGRVLIAPTGPDPVLAGIRGDSPGAVLDALARVDLGEDPLGHVVYATNQCTGAHLSSRLSVPLKAFSAGWLLGEVESSSTIRGSHVSMRLRLGDSSAVTCMVYEPAGDLRRVARLLEPGDVVRVSGGVRRASSKNPAVVNAEKVQVVRAARIPPGIYLPSPRAQRHLTKQLTRYGSEATAVAPLVDGWFDPPPDRPELHVERRRPRKA